MELEVRLSRAADEPWGFRLIGGTDFNMPLTVVKVLPDSPADLACLCNGDTVTRIQCADATAMTHDAAKAAVAAAADSLELGVTRGLYDPVLDECDPIYETIDQDQDDFDQPSQPTEVFQIKQFTETPLDPETPERDLSRSRTVSLGGDLNFNELRSLNESPFVLPTKPYRPFSTGPSPVPPLEKPIILNPNYHDEFPKVDGICVPNGLPEVDEFEGILSEESRFKLPISKEYDPDGTRLKKTTETTTVVKTVEETIVKEEIFSKEVKVTSVEERLVNEKKQKARFMDKINVEIDLDKIEMTATTIVDESIARAVTVADEIKKEMELELSTITSESKTSSSEIMESTVTKTTKKEFTEEKSELIGTDVVTKKSDVSVGKKVAIFEKDDNEIIIDERKEFMKQELEETIESGGVRRKLEMYDKELTTTDVKVEKKSIDDAIETGTVRRKSEIFEGDVNKSDMKVEKKCIDEIIESGSVRRKSEMYENEVKQSDAKVEKKSIDESIESGCVRRKSEMFDRDIEQYSNETKVENKLSKISAQKGVQSVQKQSGVKSESVSKTTETIQKSDESKNKEVKYSTAKLLAEQRAYTIGLQTIPHIKGTVQSSYHYDLLLKTFFIHLTDVMVALSRFILAEPVLFKSAETKSEVKKEVAEVTRVERDVGSDKTIVKESVVDQSKTERVEIEDKQIRDRKTEKVAHVIKQDHANEVRQENTVYVERMKSEHEEREKTMLSGAEMAQLSEKRSVELINKMDGVITEFQTKAGLEEEIITQRERRSRSRSRMEDEIVKESKPLEVKTSRILEANEIKTETRHESEDTKRETKYEIQDVNRKNDKNTYISICEAHVYTNKKSIFDEITEISDSTSIESIKETNIAREANEAMATERVAIELQKTQKNYESEEIVESYDFSTAKTEEVIIKENKCITEELDVHKSSVEIEGEKRAKVEVLKTIEPIVELHEDIIEKSTSIEVEKKMDIQEIETSKTEEMIIQEKKDITEESIDVHKFSVGIEGEKRANAEELKTIEPIVELHEDIVKKSTSIEVQNKIDIQEIETSEYVEESNVIKKESIQIVESQDIQEIRGVQDVKLFAQNNKIQIDEEVTSKTQEDVCIKIEEMKEVQEEIVLVKEKALALVDIQGSVSATKLQVKDIEEEIISIKEEAQIVQDVNVNQVAEDTKVTEEIITVKSAEIGEKSLEVKDECAHLKVTKEEITEVQEDVEMEQDIEVNIKKSELISESDNKYQSYISESSIEDSEYIQESSFTAKASAESSCTVKSSEDTSFYASSIKESSFIASSTEDTSFSASSTKESSFIARSIEDTKKQLTLDLDSKIRKSDSESSVKSTISTPTPSTVPPTPLTDEYVFRLQIPLPKITGPPILRSPSPEDEDPHIVKKNLVPHIDTEIIEEVVYETPLPTPPEDKTSPPKFTKPGLKGGDMRHIFPKEEIKEIERKSSLLASAIDETIKSIEEYKEEVGIDNNSGNPVVYNGFAKVVGTKVYKDKLDEINVEKQIVRNTENINKFVENRSIPENIVNNVQLNGKSATIRVTVENNVANSVTEASKRKIDDSVETVAVEGYRPVPFSPEDAPHLERVEIRIPGPTPSVDPGKAFVAANGEIMGTHQGIVDGLGEAVVDSELAKEIGKPGMTEEKIAELISGESEMLREAHVMGLSRVIKSHMHRDNNDDSSVDFKKIKPIVESLKDSEVLKALNEEFVKTREEKKKEERKWTKFLQKPTRPVPKPKFGCHGWTPNDEDKEPLYKPKIVKQPKPKVAPDYIPQDFNTGPLPWEERALNEPPPPPVEPEPPILVPEETPVFLEAVDPLPESEIPDLEETGIVLPTEKPVEQPQPEPEKEVQEEPEIKEVEEPKKEEVPVSEVKNNSENEMDNRIAEQLMKNVEGMVDPNAPLEQQLAQMRAQLAALAALPGVIQHTLELVTRQLCQITHQESQSHQSVAQQQMAIESSEMVEDSNENSETIIEDVTEESKEETQMEEITENGITGTETREEVKQVLETKEVKSVAVEEREKMKREEQEILDEQRRIEKQKKELTCEMLEQEYEDTRQHTPHEIAVRFVNELMDNLQLDKEPGRIQRPSLATVPSLSNGTETEPSLPNLPTGPNKDTKELMADLQLDQEARQLKQRPTPRVGKPKPVFGPLTPSERPLVLPGGRKWRKPKDAYNEQFIAETLTAQAELIQGKALGKTYESVHLPYDERVNFMKYEKPPITLDHLQHSDVYKMIHGMEQEPVKRVEMLTPVIAEADYREKCRSVTPGADMGR